MSLNIYDCSHYLIHDNFTQTTTRFSANLDIKFKFRLLRYLGTEMSRYEVALIAMDIR